MLVQFNEIGLVKKPMPFEMEEKTIRSSKDAADLIRQFFGEDIGIYESFFLLLLNRANKPIGYSKISQGGVTGTVVDVRIVAKYCIETLASAVILCHNHPSGNLNPSREDLDITTQIKQTLALFNTLVFDHVILTENSYYSMADNGQI